MKRAEIVIGGVYIAKVSGVLTRVRLENLHPSGGWRAMNLATGREIRIRTAARLRREVEA